MRAFVKLRQLVLAHKDLASKLDQLERKVGSHNEAIQQLVAAIRQLMAPPDPPEKGNGLSHDPRLGQGAVGAVQTDRLDKAAKTPETHRCRIPDVHRTEPRHAFD